MIREIKFRVWDNVDYMSKPFTLSELINQQIQFTSDCIVMQCTGLKDKNGKEIYEGDIMRRSTGYVFKMEPSLYSIGKGTCVMGYQYDILDEIIGNIYENENLLNTKPLNY